LCLGRFTFPKHPESETDTRFRKVGFPEKLLNQDTIFNSERVVCLIRQAFCINHQFQHCFSLIFSWLGHLLIVTFEIGRFATAESCKCANKRIVTSQSDRIRRQKKFVMQMLQTLGQLGLQVLFRPHQLPCLRESNKKHIRQTSDQSATLCSGETKS
jgi:hypothetical protein